MLTDWEVVASDLAPRVSRLSAPIRSYNGSLERGYKGAWNRTSKLLVQ